MIKLLVTALALGVVLADGDLGYHYNVPHTSYGVPSYQTAGNVASYNKNNYQSTAQVGSGVGQHSSGYYSGASSSYPQQYAGSGYNTGGSYQTVQSTGNQQGSSLTSGAQYTGHYGGNQQASSGGQYSSGSQYSSSAGSGNQNSYSGIQSSVPSVLYTAPTSQGYAAYNRYQESSAVHKYQEQYSQVQQQPAQIFKHFYVHAAPEEPEAPQFRQPIVVPPPQKHYQIIFIKTPTQKAVVPQYIPAPQKEEKTLVYVLVDKPEEQQVIIPKVQPTKPNKPEVFFIKYNNKEGSQAVINNIVNDYNKGSTVSVSGDGSYTGHNAGQQGGSVSSGQYTQTTANDQYVTSVGSDESQSGGHYSQGGESSQSSQSASSGQYSGSSGGNTQSSGLEQYGTDNSEGSQAFSQVSVSQGSQASSGSISDGQALNIASTDSGVSNSGSYSSGNAVESSVSYDSQVGANQGLPHETYGPPNFRS